MGAGTVVAGDVGVADAVRPCLGRASDRLFVLEGYCVSKTASPLRREPGAHKRLARMTFASLKYTSFPFRVTLTVVFPMDMSSCPSWR